MRTSTTTQSTNRLRPLGLAVAGLAFAVASIVGGQQAEAAPGDHIRAGTVVITPSLGIGGLYRSNIYRDEDQPTDGFNVRLSPGLSAVSDTDKHAFSLTGAWGVRKFLYLGDPNLDPQLEPDFGTPISALDTFTDFNAYVGADMFKKSMVGLELSNQAQMRNVASDAEFSQTPFTSHFRNTFDAGIRLSPGTALHITPGGRYAYDYYWVVERNSDRQFNARDTYGPTIRVAYDFLPKTSAVVRSELMWHRWQDTSVQAFGNSLGNFLGLPNSTFFRLQGGLEGQITERLSTELTVGYGLANYDEDSLTDPEVLDPASLQDDVGGLESLLVRVNGRYNLADQLFFNMGYDRSFDDSWFTNFVTYDQFSVGLDGNIGRVFPSIRYTYRPETYRGEINREDIVNQVAGDVGVAVSKWARVTVGGGWQQRASSAAAVEFDDVSVEGRLDLTY